MRGAPALLLFPENRENIRENPFFGASDRPFPTNLVFNCNDLPALPCPQ
jgi:hypothetical protein